MITSVVESITPCMAQEYLGTIQKNRNICPSTVDAYRKAMLEGKWVLNGDSIVFDESGALINGQHRLTACIKADVPFTSMVVRGVGDEAFATYDCGRHRTAGQLIGMQDVSNSNSVASVISCVHRMRKGEVRTRLQTKRDLSNADIVKLFNEDANGYIEVTNIARYIYGCARLIEVSMMGALIYVLWKDKGYDLAYIKTFFEGVCSYRSSDNPTLEVLRTRLVRYSIERDKKRSRAVTYNLIAKTWCAYVSGKTIKAVSWTENQKWTELI